MKYTLVVLFLSILFVLYFSSQSCVAKPIKKVWMVSLCLSGHISTPMAIVEELLYQMQSNTSQFEYHFSIVTQSHCKASVMKQLQLYPSNWFEFIFTTNDIVTKPQLDTILMNSSLSEAQKFDLVWNAQFIPLAIADYELLLPLVTTPQTKPDIILLDSFSMGIKFLALDFQIPLIQSNPTILLKPMESFSYPFVTSYAIMGKMNVFDRLQNIALTMSMIPVFWNIATKLNAIPYRVANHFETISWTKIMDAKIHFVATAKGVGYVYPNYPPNEYYFGAILSRRMLQETTIESDSVASLMETNSSVIYVSMGTVVKLSSTQFDSMLQAFSTLTTYSFVWSIPKYQQLELLRNDTRIPSHIHIVEWAPQLQVLQKENVILFITHAGSNSLHESLYAGKPMICIPGFGDQIALSGIAEFRKFGKRLLLHSFSSQDMVQAIQTVVSNADYTQNARKMSTILKIAGGAERAAKVFEELVALEGEYKFCEPSHHILSLIEKHSLDIWILMIVMGSTVYYSSRLLWNNVWKTKSK